MKRIPEQLNLEVLQFLQHGDREKIAAEDRKEGYLTHRNYVSEVLRGKHRNDRILVKAIKLAISRKDKFPTQAITV